MNSKNGVGILMGILLCFMASYCSTKPSNEDLKKKCCKECLESFSQSPVGVGPSGARCGAFTTAKPMSEACQEYFAQNSMMVADCE